jgi:hypothetical protein
VAAPFDEFPPQVVEAVEGLAWLGHLESDIHQWGHSFVLRTLRADEELEVALLAKDYQDTYGQVKAHAWAHLALSVVAVDGEENFCPAIGPDKRGNARAKFNWMTENWYWPVGEYLFGKYVELIQRQAEAVAALDSLSNRGLRNSWPTQDSLTDQADSDQTSTASDSDSSTVSTEQMQNLASELD